MANQGNKDPEKASREVGQTVDVFNARMQRRLKERVLQEEENQRATDTRHQRMLQALTVIRKALGEAAKISFNDRFGLALKTSDWEGWPRMDLVLVDGLAPTSAHSALTVTAHDRQQSGTVQLITKGGDCLARLFFVDDDSLQRLPLVLKSAIRKFLDQVSPYVLNPPDPDKLFDAQTANLAPADQTMVVDEKLSQEEFFTQDGYRDDALVEEVDVLPVETNNE